MSDQEWRRIRRFLAWGVFGLIILIGVSIIASLLFFGARSQGTFYPFFPAYFFPFHFGWHVYSSIHNLANILDSKMGFPTLEKWKPD